jgi:prolyl-tRNA synthetase
VRVEGLLGRTLRTRPSGVSPAMAMAARAGLLRARPAGWVVLPLGMRVLDRMAVALMKELHCQQVSFLVDQREGHGRALSDLLLAEIQSYRHLPLRIVTSWRADAATPMSSGQAELHPWLGIAGAFADADAVTGFLGQVAANARRLAASAGLDLLSATGSGGSSALMAIGPTGRDIALSCETCGSSHVLEAAPFAREQVPGGTCDELTRVHTPGASTIQALATMLGVGRERTLKALFLSTETGDLVFALVRGDLDASLEKLAGVVGAGRLRPATDPEIASAGAIPGFAGPIGIRVRRAGEQEGVRVVADLSVFTGADFAVGANAEDYHLVHVDPHRDFSVTEVADIALAPSKARCAACGATLTVRRGTIVALCAPLAAPSFSDETGGERRATAAWMALDMLALFEQVVGACADDSGIAWPALLAPADVYIVGLRETETCLDVARVLEESRLSILLDDRLIGAGAKFADADLIGCPLRVTVSSRSLQAGGAELAGRKGVSPLVVPLAALPELVRNRLAALMST